MRKAITLCDDALHAGYVAIHIEIIVDMYYTILPKRFRGTLDASAQSKCENIGASVSRSRCLYVQ